MWASVSCRQTTLSKTNSSTRVPFLVPNTVSPSRYSPGQSSTHLRPTILVSDRESKKLYQYTPGPGQYYPRAKSASSRKANLIFPQEKRTSYFDQFKSQYELPAANLNECFRHNQSNRYSTKLYRSDRLK